MLLHGCHRFGIEGPDFGCGAEGAVTHMAPRPPGNLRDLDREQSPRSASVEFGETGEGHMVDIHVEAHADRIRRYDVIDLTRLKHLDLGITGTGTERAEHDRRPAAVPPHQFGDLVNISGRECDNGAALRQPGDFFRSRIRER